MSGISEITLDNTNTNSNELKKIHVEKTSGSQSPTASNSIINKIDIIHDKTSKIGGTHPD